MPTITTLTTAEAINDPSARSERLTVPLTPAQSKLVKSAAQRLGWSKSTLAREAIFRFTAAIETNRALSDPTSPLASFISVDELVAPGTGLHR
jgi:hypothetical protein